MKPLMTMDQASAYESPWSLGMRLKLVLWVFVWAVFYRTTPKPLSKWRVFLLRMFGCKVSGTPFVASSSRVKFPWKLTLEDRACLGPQANAYNLAPITLKARSTIAQEVYLCAGTHDFTKSNLPLVVGEIIVGEDAFVGARALVLPGVEIGTGAVVGAASVVAEDVVDWMVVAGNPAKPIKTRTFDR